MSSTKAASSPANKQSSVQISSKTRMKKMDPALDFSFLNIITPKDLVSEEPRGRKERKEDEKYATQCLKLNNNHIQELAGFMDVINEIILRPDTITWIDLSFNNMQKIDAVFLEFPHLQMLYLHGNDIADIHEVDKLAQLFTLKKLALHGNSMETTKHYRLYVLAHCPQLINFDMSTVTKAERATAATLFRAMLTTTTSRQYDDDD